MSYKEKVLEKLESIALLLIRYWYVDITIALIGFALFLLVQKLRKHKT
jgi:hypothetical protein